MSSFFFSNHEADEHYYRKCGKLSIDTCENVNIYHEIQEKAKQMGKDGISNLKMTTYQTKTTQCILASGDLLQKITVLERLID